MGVVVIIIFVVVVSYFTCLEGSGRLNLSYFTCLEGSGRLDLSYFTCMEGSGRLDLLFFANHMSLSCFLRHVGSDPQAERGRGEVNLSPKGVLTLRPRVLGFYVSAKFWGAQFVVFYVSGRLWGVQLVVFYVSGRLWEVQFVVFYVSGRLWEAQSVVFYGSGSSKPRKIQDICPVLRGVGRRGPPFAAPCFFEGQSPFCRKGGISFENIDFSRWGRKSAPLKTSRLITSRL